MILNRNIDVNVSSKNLKHYLSLGYEAKLGEMLPITVDDLPKGSHVKVSHTCDICGVQKETSWKTYLQNTKNETTFYTAIKCCGVKKKETNMSKYGVEYVSQLQSVKDKTKETCKQRYGVEYSLQSKDIREKIETTCLEKYGSKTNLQCEDTKEKIKKTNKEKYGVEYISQSDIIKNKVKQTVLNKYGVENIFQLNEIQEKSRETCLEKYGEEYYSKTNEFKSSYSKKCKGRTEEEKNNIIYKMKETTLKRYGVDSVMKLDSFKNKQAQSMYKNSTQKCSKQQLEIYNMLKEKYDDVLLNHPINNFTYDILLKENGIKIDIEYDGWYWHQDSQRDLKRDKVSIKNGYKVLRIRSGKMIPSVEELIRSINLLLNTDRSFTEIILDDWREVG